MIKVNKVLKAVLPAVFVFGTVMEGANAAQRIQVHADYRNKPVRELEQTASRLRHHVEHPETVVHELANTDALEMLHSAKAGNLNDFTRHFATAAGEALDHYIETNLLAGNGTAMLLVTTANLANAAPDNAVYALVTNAGGGAAAGAAYNALGGWGVAHGPTGNYVELEMPANLTKGAFVAALKERLKNVTVAHLHAIHGAYDATVIPGRLSGAEITATKNHIRDALKAAVLEWLTLLDTTGGGNMFHAAVRNVAGNALITPHLTTAGAGGPGMSIDPANRAAPHPATLSAAHMAAAFNTVIDFVDLF